MSISFRERKAASLAAMTADQRTEYDNALEEERERLRLAEVVHEAAASA